KLRMYERAIKIFRRGDASYIQRLITPDQHKTSKQRWRHVVGMSRPTRNALRFHGERKQFVALQWITHEMINRHEGSNGTCGTRSHTTTERKIFVELNGNALIETCGLEVFLNRHTRGVTVRIRWKASAVSGNGGDHDARLIPYGENYLIAG